MLQIRQKVDVNQSKKFSTNNLDCMLHKTYSTYPLLYNIHRWSLSSIHVITDIIMLWSILCYPFFLAFPFCIFVNFFYIVNLLVHLLLSVEFVTVSLMNRLCYSIVMNSNEVLYLNTVIETWYYVLYFRQSGNIENMCI